MAITHWNENYNATIQYVQSFFDEILVRSSVPIHLTIRTIK